MVNVAATVPALPSVTVTSLIEIDGVGVVVGDRADALAVGDRGVRRRCVRLTKNVSFGLVDEVALDQRR